MKNNSRFILSIFFTLLFSSLLISQDYWQQKTGYLTARVKKQIYPDNTSTFFNETTTDFGAYIPYDTTSAKVIFRSIRYFDLPRLEAGAKISKIELKYKCNAYNNFDVGYISNYSGNPTLEEKWNLVSNSTYLGTMYPANNIYVSLQIPAVDIIKEAYLNGKTRVYFSFKDNDEIHNSDLCYFVDLLMIIYYDIYFEITADNNFAASDGSHGLIKVNDTTRTAPYLFNRKSWQSVTLQALSPQTDNQGYQRIWNTSSCITSDWKRNDQHKSYDQTYTFNSVADDDGKTYTANFAQIRTTTSGIMPTNEIWFSNVSLTNNVYVPSGVTLDITSCATVNLVNGSNKYSIISTGGTINNQGTINGLAAQIINNFGAIGYCGTVQSAFSAAGDEQTVYIQPNATAGNLTINGKYGLVVHGGSNSNLGSISVTNCNNLHLADFPNVAGGIFINSSPYTVINHFSCFSSGSGTGLNVYNSGFGDFNWSYFLDFGVGFNAYSSNADFSYSIIDDAGSAVGASNYSNVELHYAQFCGISGAHLSAAYGANVTAYNCTYDNGIPRISEYQGNVDWYGASTCPSGKISANNQKDPGTLLSGQKEPLPELLRDANKSLRDLRIKISADTLKNKIKDKYLNEFLTAADNFKNFIDQNPNSVYAGTALVTAVHCYKAVECYDKMRMFLKNIDAKKPTVLQGLAKRYMIDYFISQKDYSSALSLADELLKDKKTEDTQLPDILYAKGLLLAYNLEKPAEAVKCFQAVVNLYPGNPLVDFAENQLTLLGASAEKNDLQKKAVKEKGFEIVSYPNPFNPVTTIKYNLPSEEKVTLKVFDVLGREITTLVNDVKTAGEYSVTFDASHLASGIYFYTITAGKYAQTNKMILTK